MNHRICILLAVGAGLLAGCASKPATQPRVMSSYSPIGSPQASPLNSKSPILVPTANVAAPQRIVPAVPVAPPTVLVPAPAAPPPGVELRVPVAPGAAPNQPNPNATPRVNGGSNYPERLEPINDPNRADAPNKYLPPAGQGK